MRSQLHTVLFFLDNRLIGKIPYSQFADDPYFPRGGETVEIDGITYKTIAIRRVAQPKPGEVCVNVELKSDNTDEI